MNVRDNNKTDKETPCPFCLFMVYPMSVIYTYDTIIIYGIVFTLFKNNLHFVLLFRGNALSLQRVLQNTDIFAQSLSNHHLEQIRAKEYTLGTCLIGVDLSHSIFSLW